MGVKIDMALRENYNRGPALQKFGKMSKIPYGDEFNPKEMDVLKSGLRPSSAEDLWLSHFRGKTLFLHRARTGKGIYQIRFKLNKDGTGRVKWAKACKDIIVVDKHYEAALLDFIIAHIMLGYDIEFPRHIKVDQDREGHFQKEISGTQCTEKKVTTKLLKGRFK